MINKGNIKKSRTLLMVANVDWFFISHRLCIAKEAVKEGWRVIVVAKDTGRAEEIIKEGVEFINLPITRSGTNPFSEFKIMYMLLKIYKNLRPDIVHHITMKPIIYGSIIARVLKIKGVVNAISGLGYNFTNDRGGVVLTLIMKFLRIAFQHKRMVLIFQNRDDFNELRDLKIINPSHEVYFIKGSGVDLMEFQHFTKNENEKIIILFASRMIWEKGIKELINAAELLKEKYFGTIFFKLYGQIELDNKSGVSEDYLADNKTENYFEWFGYQEKLDEIFRMSDIIVFPSYYREGIPKTLIEACASGKPIVTTDSIGCKECVDEGLNGYKVPVKSIIELAEAIEKLINSPEDRLRMGKYSREKAEKEFDQQAVVKKHLKIFNSLLEDSIN